MNNRQKNWLLVGPVVFSFALAMTVPVIQIYFMRLINSEVLAISNMLAMGIALLQIQQLQKNFFLSGMISILH